MREKPKGRQPIGGNPSAGHDRDKRAAEPALEPRLPRNRPATQRTGHGGTSPEGN